MVPFVDGWATSPIWTWGDVGGTSTHFNIYYKGENLTEEYIRNQDMYLVINGFRTDITVMRVQDTADGFLEEIKFDATVTESDRYQLVIGETISGEMASK